MKKYAPYFILFILSILIWEAMFDGPGMSFSVDGDAIDGPVGGLLGLLFGAGGLLIGLVVSVFVAIVLAVVFAGVGVIVVTALVLAALVALLAVSPVLLPLLIPIGIIWYLASRNRQRQSAPVVLDKPASA